MSVQVSKKKQIIFGIIILVILLGTIEAAANVWQQTMISCPFENSELYSHLDENTIEILCRENIEFTFLRDRVEKSGETAQINSEGFRGDEFSVSKPTETYIRHADRPPGGPGHHRRVCQDRDGHQHRRQQIGPGDARRHRYVQVGQHRRGAVGL